jgi:anti-anti-sigma factor
MQVEQKQHGEVVILVISGRLDNPAAQELVKTVTTLIESGTHQLLINFEPLTYLSSSGLRVLLGAEKRIQKKGGQLAVCGAKGLVRRVVELTGFDKIMAFYESEAEALEHFA